MTKKLAVGVLAAALLMSGALVGVSFGGGGGITEPQVIELTYRRQRVHFYPLREGDGRQTGQVTLIKRRLLDAEGNSVGHMNISCTVADRPSVNWVCDSVLTLKAGPHTERGTVVTTGIYASPEDRTNSDVFAVTGDGSLRERPWACDAGRRISQLHPSPDPVTDTVGSGSRAPGAHRRFVATKDRPPGLSASRHAQ